MPCSVDSQALTSLASLKAHLGLGPADIIVDAFSIYHDGSSGATAATVEVTDAALILTITGGANEGTQTLDFATSTTVGDLLAAVAALDIGWVTTSYVNPSSTSSDLVRLASADALTASNEQRITIEDNCTLADLINAATLTIERTLNRKFKSQLHVEDVRATQSGELILRNPPIIDVRRVSWGRRDAIIVQNTSSDAASASVRLSVSAAEITLTIIGGTNDGSDTIDLTSSTTLTAVVTAIDAVGKGWSATIGSSQTGFGNHPSGWLLDAGGKECLRQNVYLQIPEEPLSEHRIYDVENGIVNVVSSLDRVSGYGDAPWTQVSRYGDYSDLGRHYTVEYTGGWATVPADVEEECIQLVKRARERREINSALKSARLGDHAWEANLGGDDGMSIRKQIMTNLGHYADIQV